MDRISDLLSLWPAVLVAVLAIVFIRAGRAPRRHGVRSPGDYARDAARSGGHQELRGRRDIDFGDAGGGGDGGGSD